MGQSVGCRKADVPVAHNQNYNEEFHDTIMAYTAV